MNKMMTLALAFALGFTSVNSAMAFDENSTAAINIDAENIAVQGYDVVSYFAKSTPEKGKDMFTAKHNGATYHFAKEIHRDAFVGNPDKYAPQYGGFCAMGAALNKKFDADPTAWKIIDNKLYLNLNADVQSKWTPSAQANIDKANMLWSDIKDKAPKSL